MKSDIELKAEVFDEYKDEILFIKDESVGWMATSTTLKREFDNKVLGIKKETVSKKINIDIPKGKPISTGDTLNINGTLIKVTKILIFPNAGGITIYGVHE